MITGDASDLASLATALRPHPIVGHDIKELGGHGPASLLSAARLDQAPQQRRGSASLRSASDQAPQQRRGSASLRSASQGLDLAHDTMVAAYLIDPARRTYDLHELAADAGLAAAPAGARTAS